MIGPAEAEGENGLHETPAKSELLARRMTRHADGRRARGKPETTSVVGSTRPVVRTKEGIAQQTAAAVVGSRRPWGEAGERSKKCEIAQQNAMVTGSQRLLHDSGVSTQSELEHLLLAVSLNSEPHMLQCR